MTSTLRIGSIYPSILGTYGDNGNARVLKKRAEARGYKTQIVEVEMGDTVPEKLDIYTLGGSEDSAQILAVAELRSRRGLQRASRGDIPVLAVSSSYQILGHSFVDTTGVRRDGLGLLDIETERSSTRAAGELVIEPKLAGLEELLTGYENHSGRTRLAGEAHPLGRVLVGAGNDPEAIGKNPRCSGAYQRRTIGTYMHGPVLARNPELADLLLEWAIGEPLSALDMPEVAALRAARLAASEEN